MHTLLLFLVTREMHLIRETIESLNGNCARTITSSLILIIQTLKLQFKKISR